MIELYSALVYDLLQILHQMAKVSFIDYLTLIILTLTLIAVTIYTYLTFRLQKSAEKQISEVIKQRRLSILPSLQIYLVKDHTLNKRYAIQNLGNGVAIDINITTVFYCKDFITEKDSKTDFLPILHLKEEAKIFADYVKSPLLEHKEDNLKTVFCFSDIEGNRFQQTNTIKNNTLKIGFVTPLSN